MMTDTVHNLPLPVSETYQQKEVSKNTLFMMYKVMADAYKPNHQWRTKQSNNI